MADESCKETQVRALWELIQTVERGEQQKPDKNPASHPSLGRAPPAL